MSARRGATTTNDRHRIVASQCSFGTFHTFTYYVYVSRSPPTDEVLCGASDLWFNLSSKQWCHYKDNYWRQIPPIACQSRGFHSTYPGIRLAYDPSKPTTPPKWIYANPSSSTKIDHAVVKCPENAWVLQALELWLLQDFCHPRVDAIFNCLLAFNVPLPPIPTLPSDGIYLSPARPSLQSAVTSLAMWAKVNTVPDSGASGTVEDSIAFSTSVSVLDFYNHYVDYNRSPRSFTCLGAPVSNSQLSAPHSLYDIKYTLPQSLHQEGEITYDPSRGPSFPEFDCTYGMPGGYTDPHQDYFIAPQMVLHISGAKLWFSWPMNRDNLRLSRVLFLSGYGTPSNGCILNAITSLTGLTVSLIQTPDTVFVLPPCQLHAVVTIERACHSTAMFCHYEYFDAAMTVLQDWIMEWHHANTHVNGDSLPELTYGEIQNSTAPVDLAVSLCTWARYLQHRRNSTPPPHNQHTIFSQKVEAFLFSLEACTLNKPIEPKYLGILKAVARNNWDFTFEK